MQKTGVFIAIGVMVLLGFGIYSSNRNAQIEAKSYILYYGDTCPHCKDVDEFIKANDLMTKLPIVRKEVYQNQGNAQELTGKAKECGLDTTNGVGVPLLWFEEKCYQGTPEVIGLLAEKAGIEASREVPVATEAGEIEISN